MLETVQAGTALPNIDIELVPSVEDRGPPKVQKITEFLGGGKAVLLGMPGAFTPTCTDKHLPGLSLGKRPPERSERWRPERAL